MKDVLQRVKKFNKINVRNILSNITSFNNQDAIVNQLKIITMIFINITVQNLDIE